MAFEFLDKEDYRDIVLYRMAENKPSDSQYFIKKYVRKGKYFGLHRHEYMQINYVWRGKGFHYVRKNEYAITKGDIFVIPPYIPHSISSLENEEIEICEFEFMPEFINQNFGTVENASSFLDFAYIEPFLASEVNLRPRLNLSGECRLEVETLLQEAIMEDETRKAGYQLVIRALLLKLLVAVGREFSDSLEASPARDEFGRHRDAISAAVRYISENYMRPLSPEEVARRHMLSVSYFRYLFRSITSKTFTEYLNGIRMNKAMELLKSTDMRVIDISLDTGFNSVNHFNKMFKHYTGVTPLAYRKNT